MRQLKKPNKIISHGQNNSFIFALLCAYSINSICAQFNDTNPIRDRSSHFDTIPCGEYYLTLCVPELLYRNKLVDYYEEGFFVVYPYKDSAYLFVHKGHNVIHPFCDTSQIKLKLEDDNMTCYWGQTNNRFIKEIYYKKRKFTMSYVNVKKDDLLRFDSIVSSLTITTNLK